MECRICGNGKVIYNFEGMLFCPECNEKLNKMKKGDQESIDYFKSFLSQNPNLSEKSRNFLLECIPEQNDDIKNELQNQIEQFEKNSSEMILTTGNIFEGYIITDYVGIVHAESSIGNGVLDEFFISLSDALGKRFLMA